MNAQTAEFSLEPGTLGLGVGDITAWPVTAVVNAANSRLAGGGGVDGAIHRAAGPRLPEACREIIARVGQVKAGHAAITPGFAMKAKFIIHAVGPIWRGGDHGEPQALASAYRACLELCRDNAIDSVAFPAISCGAYGYPVRQAAAIALSELAKGLRQGMVQKAWMVLFSSQAYDVWLAAARETL